MKNAVIIEAIRRCYWADYKRISSFSVNKTPPGEDVCLTGANVGFRKICGGGSQVMIML